MPEEGSIVPTAALLVLHVPPVVVSARVIVRPTQTNEAEEVIAPTLPNTFTVAVTEQPAALIYVIVAAPGEMPLTTPVPEPIVAMAGLLLLHVPPVVALLRVVVKPGQTLVVPVIAVGNGFTVNVTVFRQPVAIE